VLLLLSASPECIDLALLCATSPAAEGLQSSPAEVAALVCAGALSISTFEAPPAAPAAAVVVLAGPPSTAATLEDGTSFTGAAGTASNCLLCVVTADGL
jgi:hypothetical protein